MLTAIMRQASSTFLPLAKATSAVRNFLMISSGVCRFLFMESVALTRRDSHNSWTIFWGSIPRALDGYRYDEDPLC